MNHKRRKSRKCIRCKLCTKHRYGNSAANIHPSMVKANLTFKEECL